ncbi:MAG: TonB C-terminal domain-containing protein [Kiritimatiellales bacterium]
MKRPADRKIFWWVLGTHGGILFLLLVIPWLKGCFRPKPKEIVTFVDIAPPPAASESIAEPTAEPEPSIPEPVKKPAPLPPPTNTPPKKVESKPKPSPPKPAPKKPDPPPTKTKPKTEPKKQWKPTEVVRQDRKVANPNAPKQPQVDFSRVKSALQSAAGGTGSGSSSGSVGGSYSSLIYTRMYALWRQPPMEPIGTTGEVTVCVERNGRVSSKYISRRSGNANFDRSLQEVLNQTITLPVPPSDIAGVPFTITFVLN